jgi:hypothetical protein
VLKSRDESRAFLAFAAAVFVFHNLPALAPEGAEEWIDLLTPFAVVGTAALVLGRGLPTPVFGVAVVAALLYVDGHGIHLAANAIRDEEPTGNVEDVAHFWDEEWSHIEWHLGLFMLIAAFCLANRARPRLAALSALLLGWTFFSNTVEGGTWWLELAATAVFVPWALAARRPILVASAAAFAIGALLIGIWAIWQSGMPQFSDVGYL